MRWELRYPLLLSQVLVSTANVSGSVSVNNVHFSQTDFISAYCCPMWGSGMGHLADNIAFYAPT